MSRLAAKAAALARAWDGPLTRDLVQAPGDFGLGRVPARLQPDATTTTVCGFCSTGCGLTVHLRDGQAVNLSADTDYPVNLGMACPKGWEALTPLAAPDRALTPMRRGASGRLEPIDWESAMVLFCGRLKEIRAKHGPESAAFLGTGQIVTEEMALLGALWKFGMGFIHCDSNTRQCRAPRTWLTSSRSASTRRRSPTRTSRRATCSSSSARTRASPTRSCGSA